LHTFIFKRITRAGNPPSEAELRHTVSAPQLPDSRLELADGLAAGLGAEGAPDAVHAGAVVGLLDHEVAGVDCVADEANGSVGQQAVDAAGVTAGGGIMTSIEPLSRERGPLGGRTVLKPTWETWPELHMSPNTPSARRREH